MGSLGEVLLRLFLPLSNLFSFLPRCVLCPSHVVSPMRVRSSKMVTLAVGETMAMVR